MLIVEFIFIASLVRLPLFYPIPIQYFAATHKRNGLNLTTESWLEEILCAYIDRSTARLKSNSKYSIQQNTKIFRYVKHLVMNWKENELTIWMEFHLFGIGAEFCFFFFFFFVCFFSSFNSLAHNDFFFYFQFSWSSLNHFDRAP